MNDKKEFQNTSSDWILHINKLLVSQNGQFKAKDDSGFPIILQWEKVDLKSSRLNEIIKDASDILIETYASMELQFVEIHPDTVSSEMFLKPLRSLFECDQEKIDWKAVEKNLKTNLHQFFTETDFAKYADSNEIQIFVIAKYPKTNEKLGIIQFLIRPEFAYGTVKVAFFAAKSSAQNRGIEKLLLSSIFKLIPNVTRIFLHTRITNEKAINTYGELGFVKFTGPLTYWSDFEYLIYKSDVLQKSSQNLDTVK